MGLVLRRGARLRHCLCTEDNSAGDGRNSAGDAFDGDTNGRRGGV